MAKTPASGTITIRTSTETLSALGNLADAMQRPRNWVVEEAIQSYLDAQAWQVEGIREAISSLDRGEEFKHEDVFYEVDQLISSNRK